MIGLQEIDRRPKLIFENGDKENGKLLMVIIVSEEWEGRQYKVYFCQKDGRTCIDHFELININYECTDDLDWVPKRFFDPDINHIKQARAIFAKYGLPDRHRKSKNKKIRAPQARLL
jgi:hypothetical protein